MWCVCIYVVSLCDMWRKGWGEKSPLFSGKFCQEILDRRVILIPLVGDWPFLLSLSHQAWPLPQPVSPILWGPVWMHHLTFSIKPFLFPSAALFPFSELCGALLLSQCQFWLHSDTIVGDVPHFCACLCTSKSPTKCLNLLGDMALSAHVMSFGPSVWFCPLHRSISEAVEPVTELMLLGSGSLFDLSESKQGSHLLGVSLFLGNVKGWSETSLFSLNEGDCQSKTTSELKFSF